jgi:hypothetical protein
MTGINELRVHDFFNVVALSILVTMNAGYLVQATDMNKIGTDQIGSDHDHTAVSVLGTFAVYLIIDIIWIALVPKCVASSPVAILIHHIACLVLLAIPFVERQFMWHLSICLLVEINTLFLTLRRNLQQSTSLQVVCNAMFYISWILLRLVMLPILVVFFYFEYVRYSSSIRTFYNIAAFGVMGTAFITAMSFKWTLDMLWKRQTNKKK